MASTTDRLLEMAQSVITEEIFNDPEKYTEWRKAFGTFVEGIQEVCRAHDVSLKTRLEKNGRDSFPGEFFRQPKGWEKKSEEKSDSLAKLTL